MDKLLELEDGSAIKEWMVTAVLALVNDERFATDHRMYGMGYRTTVFFSGGATYTKLTTTEVRERLGWVAKD